MRGGLMQLVVYGARDIYLTAGSASWETTYKRDCNIMMNIYNRKYNNFEFERQFNVSFEDLSTDLFTLDNFSFIINEKDINEKNINEKDINKSYLIKYAWRTNTINCLWRTRFQFRTKFKLFFSYLQKIYQLCYGRHGF